MLSGIKQFFIKLALTRKVMTVMKVSVIIIYSDLRKFLSKEPK